MLDPHYLEGIADPFLRRYVDRAITAIIGDAARRIAKMGRITDTAQWQLQKLQEMSAYHDRVLSELSKITRLGKETLLDLFDEAARKTLESDDKIYRAAGLTPVPLRENPFMQSLLWSMHARTEGTFQNLTGTTAQTATRQFERILDEGHLRMSSGAFTYQDVVKWGVRELSENGIASVRYPSGHIDYADVAYRRATMTGLNQAGLKLQEQRLKEMDADYVETTAHAGARPSHQEWQGEVFQLKGKSKVHRNFYEATGYGTGSGLGGWNCRHGFYPYYPGLSEPAHTKAQLDEMNHASVTYKGEKLSMYDATQKQRSIERQIRRYKREAAGLEAAGEDARAVRGKIREWQAKQRDFVNQTGLRRDYFRERAGKQNSAKKTF